ncbi:MAG: glycerol-3-phosphate dehydrogenase subunit GlpB [Alistipes sp.]|nr:glycerol-3-phosphate dehydrogenase subunit GlpB [Candidatus Alistipes equi]
MKFDSVIIGGGLSALMCGIALQRNGISSAIISSGQSALHFSSGAMFLAKDRALLKEGHPLKGLSDKEFSSFQDEALDILQKAGISMHGASDSRHFILSPMGKLIPAWLSLEGYLSSDDATKIPYSNVLIANAENFLDFYTIFLIESLSSMGTKCKSIEFSLPDIEKKRENPTEMRSSNIARIFDKEENIMALAEILKREKGEAQCIILPAFLGFDTKNNAKRLEELCGVDIKVVGTLPPSVPGIQMQQSLRKYYESLGGEYLLGDQAVEAEIENGKVNWIKTKNHTDIAFKAKNYILATGSFFSQGIVALNGSVKEPLFGLDTAYCEKRGDWYTDNLLEGQPFEEFGVVTDANLKGLKDRQSIDNLYVVGSILAGHNAIKDGCGAGVAVLTALKVAHSISQEDERE